jgi:hypothetical protein
VAALFYTGNGGTKWNQRLVGHGFDADGVMIRLAPTDSAFIIPLSSVNLIR